MGDWMSDPIMGGDFGYSPGEIFANPLAPGLGKPSSAQKQATTEALINATKLPMELWNTTAGMRGNVTNMLEDYTSGNYDLSKNPMYAPQKSAVESAYSSARDNILANMPSGGAMQTQLGELEAKRAQGLTDMYGKIGQDLLDKAYGAGYGTPQTSISGATAASGNLAGATAAQQASASQNAQGVGQLIGYIASK
jgi:hypothetical protein